MSNLAKLKKKAAEFEQKKQFDKALALYVQILDEGAARGDDEIDVALYNRVGDLMFRQGNVPEALTYYEKAVDEYADSGFFNNAIALCNKILRQSPGRTSIYYKLGKISARKGFKSDAKQNFLEYADRMQKAGQMDEAFRALKEFADLCPDQDDIRLMLAEQLSRRERKGEALEQLQTLYDKFSAEGRQAEARATVDRMKAIDPSLEPQAGAPPASEPRGLVFLDVSWDQAPAGSPASNAPPTGASRPSTSARPAAASAISDLPLIVTDPAGARAMSPAAPEPAASAPDAMPSPDGAPLSGSQFGALPLRVSADQPANAPDHDLALPGDLPPLDIISDPLGGPGLDFDFGVGNGDMGAASLGQIDVLATGFESTSLDVGLGQDAPEGGDLPLLDFGGSTEDGSSRSAAGGGIERATLDFLGHEQKDGTSEGMAAPLTDGMLYLEPSPGARDDAASSASLLGDLPMLDLTGAPSTATNANAGDAAFLAMMSPPGAELPPSAAVEPSTLDFLAHAPLAQTPRAAGAPEMRARETVEQLRARVQQDQDDWGLRRSYAEALLDQGEREGGLHELEMAMIGFERSDDLEAARSVADEIIRINPSSVRHHQKRVEYAFRTNDKVRLCDAYLQLADALFRTAQAEKSRAVYRRVLELNPDDPRARAALSAFVDADEPAAAPSAKRAAPAKEPGRPGPASPKASAKPSARPAPASGADDSFVNLGEMLRDEAAPKSTRMVVAEQEPTGDEQADFADMLRKFKRGIAENVDEDDHESHYDLGVAFKEMGLIDEAIAEFQKSLRAPGRRARTYEALGQCFMERRQLPAAAAVLERALAEPGVGDDQLVGVLYLLGYACEALQRPDEALAHYHRVFAVDIQFRDVADRLASLERVAR